MARHRRSSRPRFTGYKNPASVARTSVQPKADYSAAPMVAAVAVIAGGIAYLIFMPRTPAIAAPMPLPQPTRATPQQSTPVAPSVGPNGPDPAPALVARLSSSDNDPKYIFYIQAMMYSNYLTDAIPDGIDGPQTDAMISRATGGQSTTYGPMVPAAVRAYVAQNSQGTRMLPFTLPQSVIDSVNSAASFIDSGAQPLQVMPTVPTISMPAGRAISGTRSMARPTAHAVARPAGQAAARPMVASVTIPAGQTAARNGQVAAPGLYIPPGAYVAWLAHNGWSCDRWSQMTRSQQLQFLRGTFVSGDYTWTTHGLDSYNKQFAAMLRSGFPALQSSIPGTYLPFTVGTTGGTDIERTQQAQLARLLQSINDDCLRAAVNPNIPHVSVAAVTSATPRAPRPSGEAVPGSMSMQRPTAHAVARPAGTTAARPANQAVIGYAGFNRPLTVQPTNSVGSNPGYGAMIDPRGLNIGLWNAIEGQYHAPVGTGIVAADNDQNPIAGQPGGYWSGYR